MLQGPTTWVAAGHILFEKYFELLLGTQGKDSYYCEAPSTWVAQQTRLCLNIQPFQPQQAMTLNSKTARGGVYTYSGGRGVHCIFAAVYKYKYTSTQVYIYIGGMHCIFAAATYKQ